MMAQEEKEIWILDQATLLQWGQQADGLPQLLFLKPASGILPHLHAALLPQKLCFTGCFAFQPLYIPPDFFFLLTPHPHSLLCCALCTLSWGEDEENRKNSWSGAGGGERMRYKGYVIGLKGGASRHSCQWSSRHALEKRDVSEDKIICIFPGLLWLSFHIHPLLLLIYLFVYYCY